MLPSIPVGAMVAEVICGLARACKIDAGGSQILHVLWLAAALLPAAYWISERLISGWDASHRAE